MYSKMFKDSTVPRLHLAWLSCCSPHVFTDRSIIDLSIQGFGASVQSRWQQLPPVPAGELQGQGLNATDDPWTKHFFCVKWCFRHRCLEDVLTRNAWKMIQESVSITVGDVFPFFNTAFVVKSFLLCEPIWSTQISRNTWLIFCPLWLNMFQYFLGIIPQYP